MSAAPDGLSVSIRYVNHRGEEGPRHVIVTGRVSPGGTEWHPDAPWCFEAWDKGREDFRWFDPRGVLDDRDDVVRLVLVAGSMRGDRLSRKLVEARRDLDGEGRCRERERQRARHLEASLAVTRGALRAALEAVPALEARRDDLLATTNRYLGRARRLRMAIDGIVYARDNNRQVLNDRIDLAERACHVD